jgi:L-2-amino-thiazoline-4-carboxylic acid hydrolase-like protein
MEQVLPIEELAKQRLNVMVYAYSMFINNLMKEGLDREKVKAASDEVWRVLGVQAGEQLKPLLGQAEPIAAIQQAGAIAIDVHGMASNVEASENQVRTEFTQCPWQEASETLGIPEDWRFCSSGHAAFAENMQKTLNPGISFEMTKHMPAGDKICEEIATL